MANGSEFIRQGAAIPFKGGRVCLVTSSNGKRWVIPKGVIEPGQTAGETALREAWEEAGIVGVLHPEPVGSYLYEKLGRTYHVTVFVMHVTEVAQEWRERHLRERIWVSPTGFLQRIEDAGLCDIFRMAHARFGEADSERVPARRG